MSEDLNFLKDFFGGEYVPIIEEDNEAIDFKKPIRGKYVAEIKDLEYKIIVKEEGDDLKCIDLKIKIVEDKEGDKSGNRFLRKTFWLGKSEWNDDEMKGLKDLMSMLATSGLLPQVKMTQKEIPALIAEIKPQIVDKQIRVSAYIYNEKQVFNVVKELKLNAKQEQQEEKKSLFS